MTHLLSFDTVFENHSKSLVKWKKNITSYVHSKQNIFEFSRQKSNIGSNGEILDILAQKFKYRVSQQVLDEKF